MTRIILTVGCVGKTYACENYKNVYDFDKHTLSYKWERTGFEHLTDEEFKSLPNRIEKENWFEKYMEDWCKLIDSNEYDVITGWLHEPCVEYLLDKGYEIEILVVDIESPNNEEVYHKRSIGRGNSDIYWNNLQNYYKKTMDTYRNEKRCQVWILTSPIYLSDFLSVTGTELAPVSPDVEFERDYLGDIINFLNSVILVSGLSNKNDYQKDKKLIEVEYIYFGDLESATIIAVLRFLGIKPNTTLEWLQEDDLVLDIRMQRAILFEVNGDKKCLKLGEYLMKDVSGKLYVANESIFNHINNKKIFGKRLK